MRDSLLLGWGVVGFWKGRGGEVGCGFRILSFGFWIWILGGGDWFVGGDGEGRGWVEIWFVLMDFMIFGGGGQ